MIRNRCPRKRTHVAHVWVCERTLPLFGVVRSIRRCPGVSRVNDLRESTHASTIDS